MVVNKYAIKINVGLVWALITSHLAANPKRGGIPARDIKLIAPNLVEMLLFLIVGGVAQFIRFRFIKDFMTVSNNVK